MNIIFIKKETYENFLNVVDSMNTTSYVSEGN